MPGRLTTPRSRRSEGSVGDEVTAASKSTRQSAVSRSNALRLAGKQVGQRGLVIPGRVGDLRRALRHHLCMVALGYRHQRGQAPPLWLAVGRGPETGTHTCGMVEPTPLLRRVLPAAVLTKETYHLLSEDEVDLNLLGREKTEVARAVPRRRSEFATARRCARDLMEQLGLPAVPILPGPDRAPRWPPEVVGSLTHCEGFVGAALAKRKDVRSVGIDAEPDSPLPRGVLELVALPCELRMLQRLPPGQLAWDRLLFSIKEAVYKACYPLDREWRDFPSMHVRIDVNGTFEAEPVEGAPPSPEMLTGRWVADVGLVVAGLGFGIRSTPVGIK